MTDDPMILTKADVLGYNTECSLLYPGDPTTGRAAGYGRPYYSGIQVRPNVGARLLGRRELTFEGVRSTITGRRIFVNDPTEEPWHFDLAPAR